MLQIEDLFLSFGGVRAIDGLNLTVPDGTITALIGPNGAGKTSVLNVVNGFFRPQRGRVLHTMGSTCSPCPPTGSSSGGSPGASRMSRCSAGG